MLKMYPGTLNGRGRASLPCSYAGGTQHWTTPRHCELIICAGGGSSRIYGLATCHNSQEGRVASHTLGLFDKAHYLT